MNRVTLLNHLTKGKEKKKGSSFLSTDSRNLLGVEQTSPASESGFSDATCLLTSRQTFSEMKLSVYLFYGGLGWKPWGNIQLADGDKAR